MTALFPLRRTESVFYNRDVCGADWSEIRYREHPTLDRVLTTKFVFNQDHIINELIDGVKVIKEFVAAMEEYKREGFLLFDDRMFEAYHRAVAACETEEDFIRLPQIGRATFSSWFNDKIMNWEHNIEWPSEYKNLSWHDGSARGRAIRDKYNALYYKLNDIKKKFSPDVYTYSENLGRLRKGIQDMPFTLKLSPFASDLMMLAQNGFDETCYTPGHEFGHAPVALALNKDTVALYLFDENDCVVARAWGILKPNGLLVCNNYADNRHAGDAFKLAIEYMCTEHFDFEEHYNLRERDFNYDPEEVYLNKDERPDPKGGYTLCCGWVFAQKGEDPSFYLDTVDVYSGEREICASCGDRFHSDDGYWINDEFICSDCISEYYVWSDYEDQHIHIDDAVSIQRLHRYTNRFIEDYVSDSLYELVEIDGDMYLEDQVFYIEEEDRYVATEKERDEYYENLESEEE